MKQALNTESIEAFNQSLNELKTNFTLSQPEREKLKDSVKKRIDNKTFPLHTNSIIAFEDNLNYLEIKPFYKWSLIDEFLETDDIPQKLLAIEGVTVNENNKQLLSLSLKDSLFTNISKFHDPKRDNNKTPNFLTEGQTNQLYSLGNKLNVDLKLINNYLVEQLINCPAPESSLKAFIVLNKIKETKQIFLDPALRKQIHTRLQDFHFIHHNHRNEIIKAVNGVQSKEELINIIKDDHPELLEYFHQQILNTQSD